MSRWCTIRYVGPLRRPDHTPHAYVACQSLLQPGIGTYTSDTQDSEGIKAKLDRLVDDMIAWNLGSHVMCKYQRPCP